VYLKKNFVRDVDELRRHVKNNCSSIQQTDSVAQLAERWSLASELITSKTQVEISASKSVSQNLFAKFYMLKKIHCVPIDVHLFIIPITLSKINQF